MMTIGRSRVSVPVMIGSRGSGRVRADFETNKVFLFFFQIEKDSELQQVHDRNQAKKRFNAPNQPTKPYSNSDNTLNPIQAQV